VQHSPTVGADINTVTSSTLAHVFDTVSLPSSAEICAQAFGTQGGVYCNLLGIDCPRADVRSEFFLGYSQSGESYIFEGEFYEARPQDFEFAKDWTARAERLWKQGRWTPHPQRVEAGGLGGVEKGLEMGRKGEIRGVKVVYRVEETEWPST
jgi:hypothetical protein